MGLATRDVGPAKNWQSMRGAQIQYLKKWGLLPRHRLLDVGCGILRGGIPIIEYLDDGNYCGYDIREDTVKEARKEVAEAGLSEKRPSLIWTDNAHQVGGFFDVIWAFAVVIHMSDRDLRKLMLSAYDLLRVDGTMLVAVYLGPREQSTLASYGGFPTNRRPYSFYEEVASDRKLRMKLNGAVGRYTMLEITRA